MTINGIIIFFCVLLFVSLFILLFPKLKPLFFKKNKAKSKGKSKNKSSKKKKKNNSKLKPSGAVTQIRPILKPANEEKEKADLKMLEDEKNNKKIGYESTPALDFKYSGLKQPMKNVNTFNNSQPINLNSMPQRTPQEIKKDFEDIKNFLDLPAQKKADINSNIEPINLPGLNNIKAQNPNGIRMQTNHNRIDPSIFNDEESEYVDYRNYSNRRNIDTSKNIPTLPQGLLNNQMRTNNKYSRPLPYQNVNINRFKNDKNELEENSVIKYDDVDINLNKLSPKLKRLIISNILKRKDFD